MATFEGGEPEQFGNAGKVISIFLFETEKDLRQGDATLNGMDPPVRAGSAGAARWSSTRPG